MTTTTQVAALPKCDICRDSEALFDGKTTFGPWAYMCDKCWGLHGIRLGLGYGQRLEVTK